MGNDLIAKTIVNGMELYFRSFAISNSIVHQDGDIEWIIPKATQSGPAIIYRATLKEENVEEIIEKIIVGINDGTVPAWWVINPQSTPNNLKEILISKGFISMGEDEPGMALFTQNTHVTPEMPQGVEVDKVNSVEKFQLWVDTVNTALHGWDLLTPEKYYNWVSSNNMAFYLAYLEGTPVATSATIQNGKSGSVEFVSTLEEYRNRGIGTAISLAAINGLKNTGADIITLRACHDAINLYKKLGFHPYYFQTIMKYEGGMYNTI